MEKQQKQIIMTACLILVLMLAGARAIKRVKKEVRKSQPKKQELADIDKPPQTAIKVIPSPPDIEQKLKLQAERENLAWGRDPFTIQEEKITRHCDFQCTAILMGDAPLAVINDEVVGIGGRIEEYKVISIEEQKVTLERDGEEIILELGQ